MSSESEINREMTRPDQARPADARPGQRVHPFILQAARIANHADSLDQLFENLAESACVFLGAQGVRLHQWLNRSAHSAPQHIYRVPGSDEKLLLLMQASAAGQTMEQLLSRASSQFQHRACLASISAASRAVSSAALRTPP